MYEYLIQYYRAGDISFKYVKTFNMDEYVGKKLGTIRIYIIYMKIRNYNTYIVYIYVSYTIVM